MSTITADSALSILRIESPIGRIELTGDGVAVTSLSIATDGRLPLDDRDENPDAVLLEAARQLDEYFRGERREFDLPIVLGGTSFQREVWDQLNRLPFGAVVSYGVLGASTGRPTASRAVGGAIGANPIPIIVPCHRVLGTSGRITGYSAGDGIVTKAWLLDHEGITHRV